MSLKLFKEKTYSKLISGYDENRTVTEYLEQKFMEFYDLV